MVAIIQPFKYKDLVTGNTIEVSVSQCFTKLKVNKREYFFVKESGEFDGTGMLLQE